MSAVGDDMGTLLWLGGGLMVAGLILCLRRTRFGRQIAQVSVWSWLSPGAVARLELPEAAPRVGFDGWRMIGIGLLGIGYVLVGTVLLFVAPAWGALAYLVGFVGIVGIALSRSR